MTTVYPSIKYISGNNIASPIGFKAAGLHCGIKHKKNDLAILVSEVPANAAGVYTTNAVQAAPLKVTKESLAVENKMQAIIVNSGNANACTGKQGYLDAQTMQTLTAELLDIKPHLVGVASTGVIGEKLPMECLKTGIPKLEPTAGLKGSIDFSQSILTTDTVSKNTAYQVEIDGKIVTVAGTAKGSGMIHPNMATMLGFISTDAAIESDHLHHALKSVVDRSFNSITVDGDTSTNDMVLVMANGLAENNTLSPAHPDWAVFVQTLLHVCEDLGKMIAKDGEGATKLIEVEVNGAISDEEARKIAKTVVGSPLVKTAAFGCDANWGRILAAVGYSGMTIDPNEIEILIGSTPVVRDGEPLAFSEDELTEYLKQPEIKLKVNVNQGNGKGLAWGCDLTYDYVQINASYRT
ncbi:bifunctional glutamate N-acetyltransferase/amino-acid acetyltransferase ArgJ [Jeotgalibacillus sp. R-1-5s-1]|uniref:bifunctional glutamate N-acetyltransferase/amino-acid acetyltransferase ArgJ n=1 Tax=Jeotgalibacillus sp. R-1-5s-1 TaxID=2555897 RepID=UPI001069BA37|nr:bifunctional glutamate N-acetyltransferase/amino-acid acetyltransferase ArgJ [Jeotgalibacillus sp. R-1-5s-1]TFD99875.1 bifunctional glutamate N-acetyltransferase/amino-acid acetyltransferase ArgJ [Jeotgalibacillus sp. R-1-5s-1]